MALEIRTEILRLLHTGGEVSGESISKSLGVSRMAVAKHIKHLREDGYLIEAVTGRGYRLTDSADRINAGEISWRLGGNSMWKIEFLKEVDSTNNQARRRAEQDAPEGLAVIAETQTAGKGRLGRSWHSPENSGAWISVLLRPHMPPTEAHKLTLVTAVAVNEYLLSAGFESGIKWPNDILWQGRKLCGILCEMQADMDAVSWVVIGFGINVNEMNFPDELKTRTVSLAEISGRKQNRADIIAGVLASLETNYRLLTEDKWEIIREKWLAQNVSLNKEISVSGLSGAAGMERGRAVGIDDCGFLLLELPDGKIKTISGGDIL